MKHLARLAVCLLEAHYCATDPQLNPEDYNWEDHNATMHEAVELSDDEKDHLVRFCLDLSVHLARTGDAALGQDFSRIVVADWHGRGWKTRTDRSGDVRATVAAMPGYRVFDSWGSPSLMPAADDPHGLSASDREALWCSLLSDESLDETPEDNQTPRGSDAEVIPIAELRRRRDLRRKEPWYRD
ncbi:MULTISPECIES: hypothetical protein [unclassified Modestobacter]